MTTSHSDFPAGGPDIALLVWVNGLGEKCLETEREVYLRREDMERLERGITRVIL